MRDYTYIDDIIQGICAAIEYDKTSLNLNPNFEDANKKLLNLIPNKQEEEI